LQKHPISPPCFQQVKCYSSSTGTSILKLVKAETKVASQTFHRMHLDTCFCQFCCCNNASL